MRHLIVIAFLTLPFAAHAQGATVSPGMNHAQVVAALGEPATARTASEYVYMFYRNECGRACGMNDIVILRRDSVVDAIFRSASRHYTGTSSSPAPVEHLAARRRAVRRSAPLAVAPARTPAPAAAPAAAPAPKLKPGAPNDTRPSVPAGEPPVKKAAATPIAPVPTPKPTPKPAP